MSNVINGTLANAGTIGALTNTIGMYSAPNVSQYSSGTCQAIVLNAHNSNAVYQDNGLILPKSISKQSYIIYK